MKLKAVIMNIISIYSIVEGKQSLKAVENAN